MPFRRGAGRQAWTARICAEGGRTAGRLPAGLGARGALRRPRRRRPCAWAERDRHRPHAGRPGRDAAAPPGARERPASGLAAMRPDVTHHGCGSCGLCSPHAARRCARCCGSAASPGAKIRPTTTRGSTGSRCASWLPALAHAGLSGERIAAAAGHLARASDLVDGLAADLLARAASRSRTGAIVINRAPWFAAHDEVRLRALAEAVRTAGGLEFPPRFATLAALMRRSVAASRRRWAAAVQSAAAGRWCCGASRGGSSRSRWRPASGPCSTGATAVEVPATGRIVQVAAAGAAGRAGRAEPITRRPQQTMPALFVADRLVALPTVGVRRARLARERSVRTALALSCALWSTGFYNRQVVGTRPRSSYVITI